MERALRRSHLQIEIWANELRASAFAGKVVLAQSFAATVVAGAIGISRSSLHYKPRPHPSRADRCLDGEIVETCGAKPAHGYCRVAWWMHRKQGLEVNGKRLLHVMRGRSFLVTPR